MSQWQWQEGFDQEGISGSPASADEKRPLTVSQLAGQIRFLLENEFPSVWVEGEVTGFKVAQSGHVYFSLKDEEAVIDCVIWRRQAAAIERFPSDGDHIEVEGSLTTYPRGSRYQITVRALRPAGLGKLYLKFLELKERLAREGLFDPARKRALPRHPRTVGVITSAKGAAIRDIIKVLRRRAPQVRILLYPTPVQGDEAPLRIAEAIRRMNELGWADVLIVGRGGGSLEDLWAFNEEVVARAIAQSKIPVISAVGHETDFTIADFVADERAPTPSAAAEMVVPSTQELLRLLKTTQGRLQSAIDRRLAPLRRIRDLYQRLLHAIHGRVRKLEQAKHFRQLAAELLRRRVMKLRPAELLRERLLTLFRTMMQKRREVLGRFEMLLAKGKPLQQVNERRQELDELTSQLLGHIQNALRQRQHRLELLAGKLSALDPKAILSRGYSITFDGATNRVLKSAAATREGRTLRIVLHEGELKAQVTARLVPNEKPPVLPIQDELPLVFDDGSES